MNELGPEPRTFAVHGDADDPAILLPATSFEDAAVAYLEHAHLAGAAEVMLHVRDTETGVEVRFRAHLDAGVVVASA